MIDSPAIRVLNDPPLDGPTNMARDEALLVRVGEFESPPTLRLYQWDPPTISLGYFQPYADYEALPPPAGRLAVVRRTTGGGAILHDLELTYSLILPTNHVLLSNGANRLYEFAHDAVIAGLDLLGVSATRCGESDDSSAARGPFFCFQRRHSYDVLLKHNKIAGSAQRRTREAILQHGSIILDNRFDQQTTATVSVPFEEAMQRMRSHMVTQLTKQTAQAFELGEWSQEELSDVENLIPKYAGHEWTRRT
ncbi:MAG: lipoate--protein ligase family protein [Planctomycetota bacterium]|jgi:lipoate-protein ligase A